MELGKAVMLSGFVTAMTSILVYDVPTLIVSLLGTYANGMAVDYFIDGFNKRKRVCIISDDYKEIQNMILDFEAGALIFLGIFLLLSVNDTLFFIREQGKKVYLLEKYVIVPIHKKKLYEVWVRIFLETILYYIIGASCIYAIMTIANNCIFSPAVLCFGALKVLGVLIILMLFFIVFLDLYQEHQLRKK